MEGPTRIRLYQYEHSPYCIPIRMILEHAEIPFEVVNLHVCEPSPVVVLTHGNGYEVPVIEDLLSSEAIYEKREGSQEIARYLATLGQWDLFPENRKGLSEIITRYIEQDVEAFGFKVCDALYDRWIKSDMERGLLRRHKERKFGRGCLEGWRRDLDQLLEGFNDRLRPLNHMVGQTAFLLGDEPTFPDYALCGVIANFLYPGNTSLSNEFAHLQVWHKRMLSRDFQRSGLDAVQQAAADQFGARSAAYGKSHILADISDLDDALSHVKITPGRRALDVACGAGHTALFLASKGMVVTACDIAQPMLDQTAAAAIERGMKIDLQLHPSEQMPYPDSSFDLVTCRVAAHHFSSPEKFVAEMARVLKMYGTFVLIDGCIMDDHPEVGQWLNQLEKMRDPSHVRLTRPNDWRRWLKPLAMTIQRIEVKHLKMPDLEWYMDVAGVPDERKQEIREMVARAPGTVREVLKMGTEGGKTIWHWPRLTLVAGKI
jgi:SAM-dependent methyltransferase